MSGATIVYCSQRNWSASSRAEPDNETKTKTDDDSVQVLLPQAPDDTATVPEPPLTTLPLDWILQPVLARDPWVTYLLDYPWHSTAMGPIGSWPMELRAHVICIMANPEPRCVFWGSDFRMIYNQACVSRLGAMRPAALGNPAADWGQGLHDHHSQQIRHTIKNGVSAIIRDVEVLSTAAHGFLEDYYHNFTFTPIPQLDGHCGGFLFEYVDTTQSVFQRNRDSLVATITATAATTKSLRDLWTVIVDAIGAESRDVVYAIAYTIEHPDDRPAEHANHPVVISPVQRFHRAFGIDSAPFDPEPPAMLQAAINRSRDTIHLLETKFESLPSELAINTPRGTVCSAYIVPVTSHLGAQIACFVLGMNPRRPVDEGRLFVRSLRDLFARSAAIVRLPDERQSIEKANIALLDQLRLTKVKVEKNQQTIERMGRNAPAGMYIFGTDGRPSYANQTYLELYGISEADFYKQAEPLMVWSDSLLDADYLDAKARFDSLYRGNLSTTYSYPIKGPAGSLPGWIEGAAFAEHDDVGNVVSVQGWVSDVSHRKYAESVKDERLQTALANKRATDKFLDMISHEIRNPLASILLLVDSILSELRVEGVASATLKNESVQAISEAAETIAICAQHQKNIVTDVLELSKLDSDLLRLVLDECKPISLVENILKMFSADFTTADIRTSVIPLPSYLDCSVTSVMMDSSRITQIIVNLMANDIKFTKDRPERNIIVSIGASEHRPLEQDLQVDLIPCRDDSKSNDQVSTSNASFASEVYLSFSITDTGRGLSAEEAENLFQRFRQASPKTYSEYGGSGLGLFICRELVELHGGQIGVRSSSNLVQPLLSTSRRSARISPKQKLISRSRHSILKSVQALA